MFSPAKCGGSSSVARTSFEYRQPYDKPRRLALWNCSPVFHRARGRRVGNRGSKFEDQESLSSIFYPPFSIFDPCVLCVSAVNLNRKDLAQYANLRHRYSSSLRAERPLGGSQEPRHAAWRGTDRARRPEVSQLCGRPAVRVSGRPIGR